MVFAGAITFNDAVWFCLSGKAFFAGLILMVLGLLPVVSFRKKAGLTCSVMLFGIGMLLLWLSSTPVHILWWFLWVAGLVCFISVEFLAADKLAVGRNVVRSFILLACLIPAVLEYRYRQLPVISLDSVTTIYVIGDSVSSGLGGPAEQTWAGILSQEFHRPVVNLAVAGATAVSALKKQVPAVNGKNSLVFVEIGGNDILNSTNPDAFEQAMEQALTRLQAAAGRVIWFELPALPGKTAYGRIQRQLASKLKIPLIPKSILSEVFQSPQATSDSIHLTPAGHQLLADKVVQLFENRR